MTEAETVIPRAEYEALRAAAKELEDVRAYGEAMAIREEGLPLEVTKRLIEGESPVRVFREFRGFTASSLAAASGVNRVQIINIEAGHRTGSVQTLAKLAEALGDPFSGTVRPACEATELLRPELSQRHVLIVRPDPRPRE